MQIKSKDRLPPTWERSKPYPTIKVLGNIRRNIMPALLFPKLTFPFKLKDPLSEREEALRKTYGLGLIDLVLQQCDLPWIS